MTLSEVGLRNRLAAGDKLWKATYTSSQAVAFLWTWAYTTRKLGRAPTQGEHAEEWRIAVRTVERDVARFRRVYPGVDHQAVADWLNAEADRWVQDRAQTLQMPAPGWLAVAA